MMIVGSNNAGVFQNSTQDGTTSGAGKSTSGETVKTVDLGNGNSITYNTSNTNPDGTAQGAFTFDSNTDLGKWASEMEARINKDGGTFKYDAGSGTISADFPNGGSVEETY